ncbi:MAG: putative metal-binding motif-containing protein [Polyangiaceae bacterium]|nr:putative metal-binding motif-containing protein [Polyangiaceae bacterium]
MTLRSHIVCMAAGVAVLLGACSESSAPSPFVMPTSTLGGAGGQAPLSPMVPGENREPTIGGPCSLDAQCDDQLPCTVNTCDGNLGRCRFVPNDASCADEKFCNGSEYCDNTLGCRAGDPIACSDNNTCTIDVCVEASRTCEHSARDADGDGDPDWHCAGGDCDDTNARISSGAVEVCDNTRDDNCNGAADEMPCAGPKNDTCADPLLVEASGSYQATLAAARSDYALSCETTQLVQTGGSGMDAKTPFRDVVVAIKVPPGDAQDVEVVATTARGRLKLGASEVCGNPATETRCVGSFPWSDAGAVARTKLHALAPGVHPLYVFSTADEPVFLDVRFLPVAPLQAHETCATALPLVPGTPLVAKLVDVKTELASRCAGDSTFGYGPLPAGDLLYTFTLAEAKDVHLFAAAEDNLGVPVISLRDARCLEIAGSAPDEASELTCRVGTNNELFMRALGPGTYFVAVSAFGPTNVGVSLELSAPTAAPLDNACSTARDLLLNQGNTVALSGHVDAVQASCLGGAVDAALRLKIQEPSDVLLVAQGARDDVISVGAFESACDATARVACRSSFLSPLRLGLANLAPGDYRVAVESALGSSVNLTPWVRKARAPTPVASADACANAIQIPPAGGLFTGNTANFNADFDASCDFGSFVKGGAADQLLKFTLSERSRVVIDSDGSGYDVLLNVRRGPTCPGTEVPEACAASVTGSFLAFLDLTLEPGDYFLQVDGFAQSVGPWAVNVFITKAP